MATELVTKIWCDVHLNVKDEQVAGRSWALLVSGPEQPAQRTPRTVDLCEDCAADLGLIAVREAIDEYGLDGSGHRGKPKGAAARAAAPAPARTAETELACPECDYVASTRSILAGHGRRAHGKTIAELLGEPTPFVCPVCEQGFGLAQSLALHQTRTHGGGDG